MYENERQVKEIILTAVTVCGACGHSYGPTDVTIIGNSGDLWMMVMRCPGCRKRGAVAALVNGPGTLALLSPADTAAGPPPDGASPVDDRDVAAMRAFLADFGGDFSGYLGRDDKG
jgi:hypothetical protein